ncbi:MAG TPA: glycoside hydrolase family 13 protein [Micromonosporaceae bacterium]
MQRLSWSRDAVIYQVYVRSFVDSDGDGSGDLLGVVSRLDYLSELGVDALWLTPFYRSPMADGGYDVADYRDVDPMFGTLADFDKLLVESHARGLKIIIDLVPNHCSSTHPWFAAAVAAAPGAPERDLFHIRPGRGEHGELPPNNWQSIFRGPAWTRLPDGEWYLHLFAPEQPDLNWEHPRVRAEFESILRFWLDRGVDGIRIDVAHGMVKAEGLPDAAEPGTGLLHGDQTPFFDQDGVHEIYRGWRSILDTYRPERIAVAEAWLPNAERTARYVRPGELHQAFNFQFLGAAWSGPVYRAAIDESLTVMASVGAPTTWVLSNHDVVRHASRLAAGVGGIAGGAGEAGGEFARADQALGLRRARAATLLILALPGSVYLYQGEELGLPEVFDLPSEARQDPIFHRTAGAELGRDGCRVPLPWSGSGPPYGFGPSGSTPWLPQPAAWAGLSVAVQQDRPDSTLSLYRQALRLRHQLSALGDGELRWLSEPDAPVLAFHRSGPDGGAGLVCVLNLGDQPVSPRSGSAELDRLLAVDQAPVLASGPLPAPDLLPPDTAAWWIVG